LPGGPCLISQQKDREEDKGKCNMLLSHLF
jgi:hypothetical protein